MPMTKLGDAELYYEVHGEGYPLVLIRGLGSNVDHWYRQIPFLSRHYRVIAFDNRGIGRSKAPKGPFTLRAMADDTVRLMDFLEVSKAHIMALSMGGMIAQHIALTYPDRVQGLVLACTHCGGKHTVRASEKVGAVFAEFIATGSEEAAQEAARCLFAKGTFEKAPEVVEEYQFASANYRPTSEILLRQWEAIQGHDTWDALPRLKAPTLIITGKEDILVPPENAATLAERIPNAELVVVEGGGHQFLVEQAEVSNEAILAFLKRHTPAGV
jgi:3-oxoadipate enol-lactonase